LFHPEYRVEDGHYAIDWIFPGETAILATNSGQISRIAQDTSQASEDDYLIGITTGTGVTLDYGHVKPADGLYVGQVVARGELIGHTIAHSWPPPFDRPTAHLVHVGFVRPGCGEYECSTDPYPNLWTTRTFDKARVHPSE
jgi:hypothetical protein